MDRIQSNLKNFSIIGYINQIFSDSKGYEYTKKGVIRAVDVPDCPHCGWKCVRNGWDPLTRKNLFTLKIGRFICSKCKHCIKKDISLWEKLLNEWEDTLSSFFLRLSDRDVAYRVMSEIMYFLIPKGKDTILRVIKKAIGNLAIEKVKEKYQVVHYDEQHPKKGRMQKYRLTLISAISGKVIADERFDEKDSATVKKFLSTHLDTKRETIIITDDCPWYPEVFREIWGNKVSHQLCILHLNKLIVGDLGKIKTLQQMYNTYLLLDIFLDRSKEKDFLQELMKEEKTIPASQLQEWKNNSVKKFNNYVRELERERRINGVNHTIHSYETAKEKFETLLKEKNFLDKELQKRLFYIKDRWKRFTLFYSIDDCPHTNNIIENYFSSSLKTHRKKQFRTDEGLENKMKLSVFKRNEGFSLPKISFLEWGKRLLVLGT